MTLHLSIYFSDRNDATATRREKLFLRRLTDKMKKGGGEEGGVNSNVYLSTREDNDYQH